MSFKFIICFVILKISSAQLNGEFWWLNDKLKQIKGIEPLPPKFEELTEFDTDESSKVTFKDENLIESNSKVIKNNKKEKVEKTKNNSSKNDIVFPDDFMNLRKRESKLTPTNTNYIETESLTQNENSDEFSFRFPNEDSSEKHYNKQNKSSVNSTEKNKSSVIIKFPEDQNKIRNDKELTKKNDTANVIDFYSQVRKKNNNNESNSERKDSVTENICSNVKKNECYQYNGPLYAQERLKMKGNINTYFVCCILPIIAKNKHTVVFPDTYETRNIRLKRSSKNMKTISQRDFLLRKRFETQNVKSTIPTRIVTSDDDYVDPYWNIKNSHTKSAHIQSFKKPECNYQDYADNYAAELPKPGLVGIYSDNGPRPATWSDFNNNPNPYYNSDSDYSYEDDGNVFGYSTIDPRRVTSSHLLNKGRPVKITTAPQEDEAFDVESQTIKFQSKPNFQVLQGFKLNFAQTKNKFNAKITRSTTKSGADGDTDETLETDLGTDGLPQVYEPCGKISSEHYFNNQEKESGDAEIGAHPWLAVLVPSTRQQHIVCYATIIHPRAAVTAGDCVVDFKRPSPKEKLLLVAGLREINDVTTAQKRVVTIQSHPQWREENLAHNLALVHWTRPLRLNAIIQPACLANSPQTTENCKFYGWGGFDQGMRMRPRWQRASTISLNDCAGRFSKPGKLPGEAVCAIVQARGTVTGLGGSLVCEIGDRATSVGIAVHRDNAVVLLPAQEWILQAMEDLSIV